MTELIWDGKYDKEGKKVAPVRIALPFQTIETVNESTLDRQRTLDMFSTGHDPEWRNRLIWGDKKYVLPSLLPEFAGKVNLIYIDPPFNVGADFSFTTEIPDTPDQDFLVKEPSALEIKAYRDTWGRGLDSYLSWFYETAVIMRELLADNGSIYVHLDNHIGHYAKVVLDEVFGIDHFLNEVIWKRTGARSGTVGFNTIHDTLFLYSKNDEPIWNTQYTPYSEKYVEDFFRYADADGRRYRLTILTAPGTRQGLSGKPWKGYNPTSKGRHWAIPKYIRPKLKDPDSQDIQAALSELEEMGRIIWPKKEGGVPSFKQYQNEMEGVELQSVWSDISPVASQATERLGYSTQKPEPLLERILRSSSIEGNLVLDCFAGSGTTAAVAERLGRRWITCDLGRFAIHTVRKRLLSINNVKPFIIQNLGKYERQAWQAVEFDDPKDRAKKDLNYRRFILDLYRAESIAGYSWLHGSKKGRMVHVGSVEAPVTLADVKAIAAEVWKAVGKGKDAPQKAAVDILGWDFALEVNEVAKQIAAEAKVDVSFKVIPREVLEKKAVDQGDIKFFELASLDLKIEKKALLVKLKLSDFVIPPQEVSEETLRAVTHWSQWIDYWAVDWDYKNDTFHNQWQTYRTRQDAKIDLGTEHTYEKSGEYRVVIKVIDILGNDTTKVVNVQVKDAKG